MEPKFVRVTTNLPKDLVDTLRDNATDKGDTLTQGLKGAISTKLLLDKEVRDKSKILIKRKDGSIAELQLP